MFSSSAQSVIALDHLSAMPSLVLDLSMNLHDNNSSERKKIWLQPRRQASRRSSQESNMSASPDCVDNTIGVEEDLPMIPYTQEEDAQQHRSYCTPKPNMLQPRRSERNQLGPLPALPTLMFPEEPTEETSRAPLVHVSLKPRFHQRRSLLPRRQSCHVSTNSRVTSADERSLRVLTEGSAILLTPQTPSY